MATDHEVPTQAAEEAPLAMDDEMATREQVPQVWRSAQSKIRQGGGSLGTLQRTIVRHRFEEAIAAVDFAARLLGDVASVAGAENGIVAATEARMAEATTLVQTMEKNIRDLLRLPKGLEVQVVHGGTDPGPRGTPADT